MTAASFAPTFPPVRSALYDQPSPLPTMWAAAIRFFPVAVAICWPAVRAVPRELSEAALVFGDLRAREVMRPRAELRQGTSVPSGQDLGQSGRV